MPNEEKQFLEEIVGKEKVDVLEAPIVEEKPKEADPEDPESAPEEVKNRRHRRLESKLNAEREANIALNARLQAIAEAKGVTQSDYLKGVEKIYGTDSPEALAATELLKGAFQAVKEEAKNEALASYREERQQEAQAVRQEEEKLDSMIDELEDSYNVSFTPEMERTFFKTLQKVSPKDDEGNIIAYADHHAVWEDFQAKLKKPESKAKELSARSMTQSGQSGTSPLQASTEERALREMGIL